jgi:hypothetical protein
MVSKTRSLGLGGISGYEVSVECFLSGGLPNFAKVVYINLTRRNPYCYAI